MPQLDHSAGAHAASVDPSDQQGIHVVATPGRARPLVAYQGVAGAFSESAALSRWEDAVTLPSRTFDDALSQLQDGKADYAVLPVWNSTMGAVVEARRALEQQGSLIRVGEEFDVPVRHCLLGAVGATAGTLRVVASHPAALAQCRRFFLEHPALTAHAAYDTAGAARDLARALGRSATDASEPEPWCADVGAGEPLSLGVIASRGAATRYGLAVLAADVQDDPRNTTRFVAVRRRRGAYP